MSAGGAGVGEGLFLCFSEGTLAEKNGSRTAGGGGWVSQAGGCRRPRADSRYSVYNVVKYVLCDICDILIL